VLESTSLAVKDLIVDGVTIQDLIQTYVDQAISGN
jgi:hypothetical protein